MLFFSKGFFLKFKQKFNFQANSELICTLPLKILDTVTYKFLSLNLIINQVKCCFAYV